MEGIVPHDSDGKTTASRDDDCQIMQDDGEPSFGAIRVPRTKPEAFLEDVNNFLITYDTLGQALADMMTKK